MLTLALPLAAAVSERWSHTQSLNVPAPGLVRARLGIPTNSVARPDLRDLGLEAPSGREVPYFIDRPMPKSGSWFRLEGGAPSVEKGYTVLAARTGAAFAGRRWDLLRLVIPGREFMKAATVEVRKGKGEAFQTVVRNRPVFRQPDGVESLELPVPAEIWSEVRVRLDDSRRDAVPVLGLEARAQAEELPDLDEIDAAVLERTESGEETVFHLSLGGANLMLTSLVVAAKEPVFTRRIELFQRVYRDYRIQEETLGSGSIYRVALEGGTAAESLSLPLSVQVAGKDVFLRIRNGDSRPLLVAGVRLKAAPAFIVFHAEEPGSYSLSAGNEEADAKEYDVADLRQRLTAASGALVSFGPLLNNPSFRAPEALPGVEEAGTELDVAEWPYKKRVELRENGVQRLELDLETLSRESDGLADLRLMREGRQIPYLFDEVGVTRSVPLVLTQEGERDRVSTWSLGLPYPHVPAASIQCSASRPALFDRQARIYSELRDERGDTVRVQLGAAGWTRRLGQGDSAVSIGLGRPPQGSRLTLTVDNGDNPPLTLSECKAFYRSPRLLFKAAPGKELFLYYGRRNVSPPVYDLRLAARELLSKMPGEASIGKEEALSVAPWWAAAAPAGVGRWAFWGVLGLVVAGLLFVIAKLLPEEPAA
ncbi:MAG TPA: hypothetical protein DD417_16155 [Elusimicrobia bacterium]|nr:hypothetical protein [Elusimicrobiota bacterium]